MAATKKKASPAQIAARERFAEMARAGKFKRAAKTGRKKSAARTKPPARKAPSPAQLAARKKFVAMVRARAASKKKKSNSRGFSSKAPAWTKGASKKRRANKNSFSVPYLMKRASKAKTRSELRLIKGKFDKALIKAKLSDSLFSSAQREFIRISPRNLPSGYVAPYSKRKKNPGVIRMTEAELSKFGGKIKGLVTGKPASKPRMKYKGAARGFEVDSPKQRKRTSKATSRYTGATTRKKRFKKAPKRALARAFSGSGFLGLGKSRKTVRANSLFSRKKKVAKVGYRKTQISRRKVAAVGYRKTQRGQRGRGYIGNPSPAQVFSEFRGKSATSKTRVKAARGTPSTLAKLGQLRELRLRGKTLAFGSGASLAADGRKKLHVVGVTMKRPNPPGEVDYGEIVSVTYRANKPHIEQGTFDYVHKFGEDGGRKPHLIVDEEGFPLIEGGSYKIDSDGIID